MANGPGIVPETFDDADDEALLSSGSADDEESQLATDPAEGTPSDTEQDPELVAAA